VPHPPCGCVVAGSRPLGAYRPAPATGGEQREQKAGPCGRADGCGRPVETARRRPYGDRVALRCQRRFRRRGGRGRGAQLRVLRGRAGGDPGRGWRHLRGRVHAGRRGLMPARTRVGGCPRHDNRGPDRSTDQGACDLLVPGGGGHLAPFCRRPPDAVDADQRARGRSLRAHAAVSRGVRCGHRLTYEPGRAQHHSPPQRARQLRPTQPAHTNPGARARPGRELHADQIVTTDPETATRKPSPEAEPPLLIPRNFGPTEGSSAPSA
jgi:hypothetical protein